MARCAASIWSLANVLRPFRALVTQWSLAAHFATVIGQSRCARPNRLERGCARRPLCQGPLLCHRRQEIRPQGGKRGGLKDEWLGRSRGGRLGKLHLCVDGHARPLALIVTAGQRADVSQIEPILNAICVPRLERGRPRKRPGSLGVDRAYSARQPCQLIQQRKIRCICPEREDAKTHRLRRGSHCGCPSSFDPQAYKGRNVVERAINRLKDFRAVATRYDKRGYHYLATVTVATIMLWLF